MGEMLGVVGSVEGQGDWGCEKEEEEEEEEEEGMKRGLSDDKSFACR